MMLDETYFNFQKHTLKRSIILFPLYVIFSLVNCLPQSFSRTLDNNVRYVALQNLGQLVSVNFGPIQRSKRPVDIGLKDAF